MNTVDRAASLTLLYHLIRYAAKFKDNHAISSNILFRHDRKEFLERPPQVSEPSAQVAPEGQSAGSFQSCHSLPAVGFPPQPGYSLAHNSGGGLADRHGGDGALPAAALELLSRRRRALLLHGSDGCEHDPFHAALPLCKVDFGASLSRTQRNGYQRSRWSLDILNN